MEKKFEISEILIAVEKILNNDFKKSINTMTEKISFYKQKTSNFSSIDQIYNYNKNFVKSLIFKIENSKNEKKY